MKQKKCHKSEGFTFVETLAVLGVMAILTASVGASCYQMLETARRTAAKNSIAQYKSALQSYYIDCGTYPTDQQGLEALWEKPVLSPIPAKWNGPYVEEQIQSDPWKSNYVYRTNRNAFFPGDAPENLPFVIISFSADKKEGGSGKNEDICSWK